MIAMEDAVAAATAGEVGGLEQWPACGAAATQVPTFSEPDAVGCVLGSCWRVGQLVEYR